MSPKKPIPLRKCRIKFWGRPLRLRRGAEIESSDVQDQPLEMGLELVTCKGGLLMIMMGYDIRNAKVQNKRRRGHYWSRMDTFGHLLGFHESVWKSDSDSAQDSVRFRFRIANMEEELTELENPKPINPCPSSALSYPERAENE